MRVISGTLKGRIFRSPRNKRTRPMSDKVKSALFNVLGDISGLRVLDAFAGTGALSIESASRGAREVVAVERDGTVFQNLQDNISALNADTITCVRANVISWAKNSPNETFDVIICDPPYDKLQEKTIAYLTRHLKKTGVFVVSWPSAEDPPKIPGIKLEKQHTYGAAQLWFYTNR